MPNRNARVDEVLSVGVAVALTLTAAACTPIRPIALTFSVAPTYICEGESALLSWHVENDGSCTACAPVSSLLPGVTVPPGATSATVGPSVSTHYVLNAGQCGSGRCVPGVIETDLVVITGGSEPLLYTAEGQCGPAWNPIELAGFSSCLTISEVCLVAAGADSVHVTATDGGGFVAAALLGGVSPRCTTAFNGGSKTLAPRSASLVLDPTRYRCQPTHAVEPPPDIVLSVAFHCRVTPECQP